MKNNIIKTSVWGLNEEEFIAPEISVQKKQINLIVSLERASTSSLWDCLDNSNWKIEELGDFTKCSDMLEKYEKYDIKTLALVHHGNIYCEKDLYFNETADKGKKLAWIESIYNGAKFKEIDAAVKHQFDDATDEEYIRLLIITYKKKYVYNDSDTDLYNYIVTFVYLKRLLSKIVDGGTYLSIGCNEAEDPSFLPAMGNLTNKKITLFAPSVTSI